MESEGDFHFRKKKPFSYKPHRRKALPIKKIITVSIVLAIVAIIIWQSPAIITMLSSANQSNPYSGYTQIRVDVAEGTVHTIGGYMYGFTYIPDTIDRLGVKQAGYIFVNTEIDIVGKVVPLTVGTVHKYSRIEYVITEIHSEYCILMVKSITP